MATRIAPINPNIRRNNDCALHGLIPVEKTLFGPEVDKASRDAAKARAASTARSL